MYKTRDINYHINYRFSNGDKSIRKSLGELSGNNQGQCKFTEFQNLVRANKTNKIKR